MKRKKLLSVFAVLAVYCLLLLLLVQAESSGAGGTDDTSIRTFAQALWYSLVTLSTVGYGEIYPHSVAGKLIGLVFILSSGFLLAFLISSFLSLFQGRIYQRLRFGFAGERDWFVFTQESREALILARRLKKENPEGLFLFPSKGTPELSSAVPGSIRSVFTAEELLQMKQGHGKVNVFCMGENGYDNYREASSLVSENCSVYCMTEYEPDDLPVRLKLSDPCHSCARLYWSRYPACSTKEKIVLIGSGGYAEALLEQALLVNVLAPEQNLRYLVYGDFSDFRRNHPYLSQICTGKPGHDSLVFSDQPWNEDLKRLQEADRILLCRETEEETLELISKLCRYCPVPGKLYAHLSRSFDSVISFGSLEEICTPELLMREKLDRAAMRMHEIYQKNTNGAAPAWHELSGFIRRSNLASADHLPVKIGILLGHTAAPPLPAGLFGEAYRVYCETRAEKADCYRRIEHERWLRFHLLNNWQFAPVRDNARRFHPLILPYDELSPEEQAKDDFAWELLGALAEQNL